MCSIRRKDDKEKLLQMYPGDDIRETIINYADGAGEENTENFNIGIMKKPVGPINTLMQVPNGTMPRGKLPRDSALRLTRMCSSLDVCSLVC